MAVQKVFLLNQTTPVNIPSGLVPKGAYNAGTDYAVGDSVDYNGSSYVMFVDAVAGTLPTDTTKWQVLANKGATGATGATGAAGAAGANGQGVPIGGTAGQVLAKIDATDYNTQWITSAGTGDALVANPLSQFAATTSLQLKGVISDETGSGALVFADTPTLVTPVLGEATGTGITLSGLTASEMVITNGSKKLVSAAVATYPSLTELTYVKGVTSAIQTQLGGKVSDTGDTMTGALTIGLAGNALSLTNSTDNASVQVAIFEGDRATMAANDTAYITLRLSDSAGNQDEFGRIAWSGSTITSTSEVGFMTLSLINAGSLTEYVRLSNASFRPGSNDLIPLGNSTTGWSDLFLASGGVINWAAGDTTLTHSTGTLTMVGGTFIIDAAATATHAVDRGATTNFASFIFRTAGTDQWTVGLRNDSTNNLYIRDNINGVNILQAALGATPALTLGGTWNFSSASQHASIELGHASDTTLSRSAAGVLAVEGVVIPSISSTNTLTNKRITKRVVTTTDDSTAVIDTDITDEYELTAMANATTFTVTGTPTDGQTLLIRLKDNGTARALTWTMSGGVIGVTLPTTTVISKWSIIGFKYFTSTTSWKAIAVGQEA